MKSKQKVLLALSGGVDSAVAALLLQKQGYQVQAIFLKCFSDTKDPITGQCNWQAEKRSAQKIAAKLNIPLKILDLEEEYKTEVIKPMINAYKKGLTPNPDIPCNTLIKFPWLRKEMKKQDCDFIATGHYARIKKTTPSISSLASDNMQAKPARGGEDSSEESNFSLLQAKDKTKDQSYFLAELTQKDLEKTLFPVGNLTKAEVRQIAEKNKLHNHDKKSTRGICFVGKVNLQTFLKHKIKPKPGKILNHKKEEIGTHPGIQYFTIGQRLGPRLGMHLNKGAANKKWLIAKKIPRSNTLVVAPENHPSLKTKEIKLKKLHIINPRTPLPKSNLKARIRHLGTLLPGKLKTARPGRSTTNSGREGLRAGARYSFIPTKPISAVAPGQTLVLHHNQELIASGEIT
jgi:tRNA-specific 2-thiouridylase